jgi:hypothetical protein
MISCLFGGFEAIQYSHAWQHGEFIIAFPLQTTLPPLQSSAGRVYCELKLSPPCVNERRIQRPSGTRWVIGETETGDTKAGGVV